MKQIGIKSGRITLKELLDLMYADGLKGTYNGDYDRKTMAMLLRPLFKRGRWKGSNRIKWGYFLQLHMKSQKYHRAICLEVEGQEVVVHITKQLINSILMAFWGAGVLTGKYGEGAYSVYQEQRGFSYSSLGILPTSSSFSTQLYFTRKEVAFDYLRAFRRFPDLNNRERVYAKKIG